MFYVSISKKALKTVMEKAKGTDREIIGVLVGRTEKHTIVITDAVSGQQESGDVRAQLPPSTIAKVTDRILKGEIEGRIVGWYHSHPGYGLFMSGTDIKTQKTLQQFSSKVTALIVDPEKESFGFFTLQDPVGVVQLGDDQVHLYGEGEEEIPERFAAEPDLPERTRRINRQYPGGYQGPQPPGPGMKLITIAIAAAMIGVIIGLFLFGGRVVQEPDFSEVSEIALIGYDDEDLKGRLIFRNNMTVQTNYTIVQGRMDEDGLRLSLKRRGGKWVEIGNDTSPVNFSSSWELDTNHYRDNIYQIKVNFTDSLNDTWFRITNEFVIDNDPDVPEVDFMKPDMNAFLKGEVPIITDITDNEDNIHEVTLFFINDTIEWNHINGSRYIESLNWTEINTTQFLVEYAKGQSLYRTVWNTKVLGDDFYVLRARAVDSNKYVMSYYINVTVLNGG